MRLLQNRTAVIQYWVVFFLGVFILAFVWYFCHQMFLGFQTAGASMIQNMETNSTTSDAIEVFFTNVDTYILVFALFGLGYYVWQQSQKRGVPIYE